MATAAAACRRVGCQLGTYSISGSMFGRNHRGFGALLSSAPLDKASLASVSSGSRQISQLVKSNEASRLFLVNTLALVRKLEAEGMPSKQAEAITAAITEVLNDSLENVSHFVVSKAEMQKEHHVSLLQHEAEKLWNNIDNMRSELRHEIDRVTAGQRLDLNLERGRIRDELANQNAGTCNLTNKLDREIHALRAQLEAAKYDVIKYCIGSLVSISAVSLAVIRILM